LREENAALTAQVATLTPLQVREDVLSLIESYGRTRFPVLRGLSLAERIWEVAAQGTKHTVAPATQLYKSRMRACLRRSLESIVDEHLRISAADVVEILLLDPWVRILPPEVQYAVERLEEQDRFDATGLGVVLTPAVQRGIMAATQALHRAIYGTSRQRQTACICTWRRKVGEAAWECAGTPTHSHLVGMVELDQRMLEKERDAAVAKAQEWERKALLLQADAEAAQWTAEAGQEVGTLVIDEVEATLQTRVKELEAKLSSKSVNK